ncbi:dienelactone hydrolase family protein [Nonlabens ponticola]|uniref:Dienelactone hydrolase family protein n=1 Tax=Nonlabens ponticola TaxID=2496866 RepID=A0A3S9MZ63_9FLAO|nr:dienelactone hydrolase family protein [Nonlabens ponticola]AZQ44353.1 dienelactone hydrolase family protein [Nonlabens ponticola]
MAQLKREDISQEVLDLYDDYAHNKIDRRAFVERLSVFAVGALTLPSLLSFVQPDYDNPTVAIDDDRFKSEYITYSSPKGGGDITGLLSRPSQLDKKVHGIIVVHENRGLNPYVEDVGRQGAIDGFITLAPDALSPLGGYPSNDDEGRAMQRTRDRLEMLEDFIAAYHYLKNLPDCTGNVGVVGFCFGGWIANMMAVQLPDLGAAVPFYGRQPDASQAAEISAPLLLQYAGLDDRVNAGWPDYKEVLERNNIEHTAHFYDGANHGFHNYSTPRYDKEAAQLAWSRTIDFFEKHLS